MNALNAVLQALVTSALFGKSHHIHKSLDPLPVQKNIAMFY